MTEMNTPRRGRPPMLRTEAPAPEIQADAGPRKSTRKPFGAMTLKLAYPKREGFHRHWFTDKPGRIRQAQEAGYEHVLADGKPVSIKVGVAEGGIVEMGFLMETPKEWYDEDMAMQQREIDEKERAIKERQLDGQKGDRESVYGKVSIGQD